VTRAAVARSVAAATILACAASLSAGCAAVRASPAEQAVYREVRLAPGLERRVSAAARYLEQHPDGVYRARVAAYFLRAEPVLYAVSRSDADGLARYLAVLPQGPHAADARRALEAMARSQSRGDLLAEAARATERRLASAAAGRKRAKDAFARYLRLLVEPETYARPVGEGSAELVRALALELPQPECTSHAEPIGDVVRSCTKTLELPFEIRARDGGVVARALELRIEVDQDASGRPRHATISGEELFARLDEAERLVPVDGTEPRARRAAAQRAAAIVRSVVAGWAAGGPSCERAAADGEAYRASCGGVDVVVLSREDGRDVVEITAREP
jgi:hypothetical protein